LWYRSIRDVFVLFADNSTRAEVRGEYSRISFSFHIRRKPRYYILNIIVPCCLLSVIAIVTFILPPHCTERLGLSTYSLQYIYTVSLLYSKRIPHKHTYRLRALVITYTQVTSIAGTQQATKVFLLFSIILLGNSKLK